MGELNDAAKEKLRAALPAEASVKNPVDVVGDAGPDRYSKSIDICLQ